MNIGKNIYRAFEIVNKTHENVAKLIEYSKVLTEETEEFEIMSPKFLRYKSDTDYWGWNINQLFLLFQDTKDRKLKNGWRNGPIYVLEIVLYSDAYEEPMIELAKFEYENIRDFSPGVSPASYWHFTEPLYDVEYDELEEEILVAEMLEEVSRKHWGVNRIVCKVCPLVDINRENTYEMIFGTFQKLKNI